MAAAQITLRHGPFRTLNMPGMTMAFPLARPDVAQGVKAGDTVFMKAGARVSYQNGPAKMVAIQVFAGPAPADKYQQWKPAN